MKYQPINNHNIMELWIFDTCNFRCGYCGLVATGDVTRTAQLDPYRNPEFIESLLQFFRDNRPNGRPWAVLLTGGEPTLMPNLNSFVLGLGRQGDTVGIYSNMSISLEKVLSQEAISYLTYVEASFHPDWHIGKFDANVFFDNVKSAKEMGVPVLVRFVGVPQLLNLLPELEARCKSIGVSFLPTTLFNPMYPSAYTTEERAKLASYMVGYSSLIQLDGGLLMQGRKCGAADQLFAARLHKGGNITPCISTDAPVLGNIFENKLSPLPGLKPCFKPDGICSCDIHFQQNIVQGADDSEEFAKILAGNGVKRATTYEEWKSQNELKTTNDIWVGQGVVLDGNEDLLRVAPKPLA